MRGATFAKETDVSNQQGNGPDSQQADAAAGGNQQKATDQGGHAGLHGHGGQHSGGMGGEHGGDLHDIGSGQSGMTGRGGMGGNDNDHDQPGANLASGQQTHEAAGEQYAGPLDEEEPAEVQQSAQREGMGQHRHRGRGHEQALDGAADVDKLGSQESGAAKSNDDNAPR